MSLTGSEGVSILRMSLSVLDGVSLLDLLVYMKAFPFYVSYVPDGVPILSRSVPEGVPILS